MNSQPSDRTFGESSESITELLERVPGSDSGQVWSRIYGLLYEDLRRIARSQIRRVRASPLSPTSLVSEAWLRLAQTDLPVETRAHLVSLTARAMRFVLLDCARQQLADKRGAGVEMLPLGEGGPEPAGAMPLERLVALDRALEALAEFEPRLAKVVELRYFGGLTETEIASVLDVNERTVRRDWRKARAFLAMHLGDGGAPTDAH